MANNSLGKDILISEELQRQAKGPELSLGDFAGPLDLLLYLIDKNEIDLFDIPIAELTNQYLQYLDDLEQVDLENVADFINVGSDLIQIKSKMILPDYRAKLNESEDPRDELVWRLLLYRRCKYIAEELKSYANDYFGVHYRERLSDENLGIKRDAKVNDFAQVESEFSSIKFNKAIEDLLARNTARFQDLSEKIDYIVSRKHLSILDQIKQINQILDRRGEVNFNRIYRNSTSKAEVLSGFLAVLELVKNNTVDVYQREPFADIILTRNNSRCEELKNNDETELLNLKDRPENI